MQTGSPLGEMLQSVSMCGLKPLPVLAAISMQCNEDVRTIKSEAHVYSTTENSHTSLKGGMVVGHLDSSVEVIQTPWLHPVRSNLGSAVVCDADAGRTLLVLKYNPGLRISSRQISIPPGPCFRHSETFCGTDTDENYGTSRLTI